MNPSDEIPRPPGDAGEAPDVAGERTAEDLPLPGGEFRLLVQKLGYQALIGMGVLENPVTGTAHQDLPRAKTVIDDLRMLREKTHGNLDDDEHEHLASVIHDLEAHYARLAASPSN